MVAGDAGLETVVEKPAESAQEADTEAFDLDAIVKYLEDLYRSEE